MSIDVSLFYFLSVIPFVFGGIAWLKSREIILLEWLLASLACFVVAGLMHFFAVFRQVSDYETWSGRVTSVTFHPEWEEEYQQMRTRTVGSGKDATTEIYYTTEYRTHHEFWSAETTLETLDISQNYYNQIANKFGGKIEKRKVYKSGFHSGDPYIYPCKNLTNWLQPVTTQRLFENRVKAAPSTFSFSRVPEGMRGLYEYPKNEDKFHSDRLMGSADLSVNWLKFDQMNSRLGPEKRVNVIFLGMGATADSMLGEWQRSKWVGGKKNDLIVMWGGLNKKPTWVKVFGWTDSDICKKNIETLVLERGISDEILPDIEQEIRKNYKLKDWDKSFGKIPIDAPMWSIWVFLLVATISQVFIWRNFFTNRLYKY